MTKVPEALGPPKVSPRLLNHPDPSPHLPPPYWFGLSNHNDVWILIRLGQNSSSHQPSTSSLLHWWSTTFFLSSPPLSWYCATISSHFLHSLVSCLSSPVLKDQDREREQLDPTSPQALDGYPGLLSSSGMTVNHRGTSTQPTATHTTSSTAALAFNFGQSFCHHNSSGWAKELFLFRSFFVTSAFLTRLLEKLTHQNTKKMSSGCLQGLLYVNVGYFWSLRFFFFPSMMS